MTPKEKALELVGKYRIKVSIFFKEDSIPRIVNSQMTLNSSKECALIAVDELIEDNLINEMDTYENLNSEFYKNVKKEIEKL